LKMTLQKPIDAGSRPRSPALALVTLIPLAWLVAVTFTAGVQKIWHPDPRIGFLAQAKEQTERIDGLQSSRVNAVSPQQFTAIALELHKAGTLRFNDYLDTIVAGIFLVLVATIVLLSGREWVLLLTRKKAAGLRESPPVWLSEIAPAVARQTNILGWIALAFALVRELSGEAQLQRAREQACACDPKQDAKIYRETMERRFDGVNRCC